MRWSLSRTRPATDGPAAPSPLDDRDPGTEAEYDVDADVPRPRRRPTRLLVAGIVVVVGAMALWSQFGARRAELPPLPAASAAASLLAPGTSTLGAAADPAVSGGAAAPASEAASGGATDLPARPTFYRPLTSRAADTTDGMPSQGAAFSDLAREEHEAQLATIKARKAELELKTLKATLERNELQKNPGRLFKDKEADPGRSAAPFAGLPRTPPPLVATAPIPLTPGTGAATAPAAVPADLPPQMRVKMVTLEPAPEALIESIDGPERGGSFTVRAGERFPLFIVTAIDARGVTIAANGKPYFYPVGGRALGTQPATPAPATRPLTPAPR